MGPFMWPKGDKKGAEEVRRFREFRERERREEEERRERDYGAASEEKERQRDVAANLERINRENAARVMEMTKAEIEERRIRYRLEREQLVAVVKMKEEERKKLLAYLDQQRKEAARKEQEFAAFLKTKKKEEKNRRTAWEREMMRDELQLENEGIAVNWREEQEEIQRRMEEAERESGEGGHASEGGDDRKGGCPENGGGECGSECDEDGGFGFEGDETMVLADHDLREGESGGGRNSPGEGVVRPQALRRSVRTHRPSRKAQEAKALENFNKVLKHHHQRLSNKK